ncbi:CopD family protein [Streptomyces sp. TG1A-8]|uniref:copper resistance CopC/CopD family protein n=1 Tax=Streptomyces sp. TG1A-8 TaxID=3051385 RepID=UPI00265BFB0D|nr:CopD family protein [Streptomyces sp. TG1A-8]MDO0926989.1 CopD family protein [Streptomyces sp. TG1A-8]
MPGRSDAVRVPLPAGLRDGTYTVAWRVVSADSHPVSGALTFSVGRRTATTAAVLPRRTEDPVTTALHTIARHLARLALAVLLGTAAFVAYCRPPVTAHPRAPARAAWWTVLAATLALFLLRAPYEEGTSPARALALSCLARTATTRPGELLLARAALLLLAAACALAPPARWRGVPRRTVLAGGTALSVALCLTWAAAEHASAGPQVPLAVVSTTLHLLAAAAWLGGLTALLATLRRVRADPAALPPHVVPRFSTPALASVTVLVVTGTYQSWRGLGSWQALTGTPYGRLLLAKPAAVTLLLTAASHSRRWTSRPAAPPRARVPKPAPLPAGPACSPGPAAPPGPACAPAPHAPVQPGPDTPVAPPAPAAHRHLRRSVLAEVAVGMVVLVLTTLLTSTPPARAAAEAARSAAPAAGVPAASVTTVPFDVGTPGGHGRVQITLEPGRVGANSVQAVVYGPDGGLSSVPELRVALVLPARRIGPLDTGVTDRGGYWAADSFALPMAGTWTMKVTVRVSEVDQVTVSRSVRVTR